MSLSIANASAFWGDQPQAVKNLLTKEPSIDFITFDYLAEVSLSIMALQRSKDPTKGFAQDFEQAIDLMIPFWQQGASFKVVSNAGGLSAFTLGKQIQEKLLQAHLKKKIAVILGDDILSLLQNQPDNPLFQHLDDHVSLATVSKELLSANAYLGAKSLTEALKNGADIVITGRVADPSLTVACSAYHFDWKFDEWYKLAQATVAGHLIECGTQVTGGIFTDWDTLDDPYNIAFPIAKIEKDGSFFITKPKNTGGAITIPIVKEQLLYEIGDPSCYLSPDVTVSLQNISLKEEKGGVSVKGAIGSPPTNNYKVSATYQKGFTTSQIIGIFGQGAFKKADMCAEVIKKRLFHQGFQPQAFHVEKLGCGGIVPLSSFENKHSLECILRITIQDSSTDSLNAFAKEVASLVTSSSPGVCGYTTSRSTIRPLIHFWPCLIEKAKIATKEVIL